MKRKAHVTVQEAFKLYDTFGMPLDFMQDAARDQGIDFDQAGFDRAMAEQRLVLAPPGKAPPSKQPIPPTSSFRNQSSKAIVRLALTAARCWPSSITVKVRAELKAGESGEVILDHTPFYADSGGQVGDKGWFYSDDHNTVVAEVTGCYSPIQGVRAHQVIAKQAIRVGDKVDAVVNAEIREVHHAQPHCYASASCRVARSAGQACETGGIAGCAESSAL